MHVATRYKSLTGNVLRRAQRKWHVMQRGAKALPTIFKVVTDANDKYVAGAAAHCHDV